MRNLRIEHLARVEGHGAINVEIEGKKVRKVRMEILEGPRLFETLTIGKLPSENLNIVPRICAICTLSHRYASLRATEKCLDIRVPEKVRLLRDLMLLGEMIESHSLHVYLLALPDLLGYPSAFAMIDEHEETVLEGLRLKKFGNSVMECISGRATHGENPVIGGFGRIPANEELYTLRDQAKELVPYAEKIIDLLGTIKIPKYLDAETEFICLNPPEKEYGFVGDSVLLSNGDEFDIEDYGKVTNERVVAHSYAKRSLYEDRPFSVGALARVNNLGDRLKDRAGKYYLKYHNSRWTKNPLFNNVAQAIETLYALEKLPSMIDRIIALKTPPIVRQKRSGGRGTGAVEAPRGTLYHSYEIKRGRMARVDIVTPTAQNLEDIERYLKIAANHMLAKGRKTESIRLQLEIIARSFDPCISCSTHLVELSGK